MSPPTALSSVSLSNNALFEGSNLASSDEFCSELLENCKKSPHTHRRIAFNDYELYWDDLCSFENVYTTGSVENCIIHPLSGAFAAVFNTSIISIFDCHANMKLKIDPKKEGINSQVLHAEWRTSCDELVCVFADGTVGIFDYFNKSIQWLSLKRENVQTNSELEEKFVVIAAEFRNDKLYCLVRSSTLIVATLDANSNFHDIEDHQLESGCIDFSFVSDDLILFKSVQNANYAYSLSLQSGQEILNGRKIIFPVYHSRNGEYLGFFFQSRKKGLRLEICDKSMEKWYASIKLNEIPKNVMILNADLQIIFYETYFTVIIEDKFKKVDCYQSFVSLQISAFSFVLLTAVGFECLKFLRKDLFDLDEVKKLTHVQIAFALQTFLDLALQDWTENLDNFHSIWIQKAKELAAASSELVCDKTSLARSLKFIQIVARIRLDHTIACFFVSKDNFDVLVSLLIQRKAFHCCTLLADAYDCVKSLENVFIEWMIDRSTHHKHTNSFGSVSFTDLVKENSLSLCNHVQLDLKKIVEFALKRHNIQFLCILLANEHSNFHEDMYILEQIFAQKTPLIPDDFAQILLLLIQKNSVGNVFFVLDYLFDRVADDRRLIMCYFELFVQYAEVGKFFEDYCILKGCFGLLSKYYYAMDCDFLKNLPSDSSAESALCWTDVTNIFIKWYEFLENIACESLHAEILNYSIIRTFAALQNASLLPSNRMRILIANAQKSGLLPPQLWALLRREFPVLLPSTSC